MRYLFLLLFSAFSLFAKPVIVFDFSGVVGDFDKTKYENFLTERLPITSQEIREFKHAFNEEKVGSSLENFWKNYVQTKGDAWPQNWEKIVEEASASSFHLFQDTMQIVEKLKAQGFRVALLSNTKNFSAENYRKNGFYKPFEPLLLSHEIGYKKPHLRAYQRLLKELQIEAKDCIFIDNKKKNVVAARRLGIDAILFRSAKDLAKELRLRGIETIQ